MKRMLLAFALLAVPALAYADATYPGQIVGGVRNVPPQAVSPGQAAPLQIDDDGTLYISIRDMVVATTPSQYQSAASTNSTNVKASAGYVYGVTLVNTSAAAAYLKLYDKATAPTCGTDTPVQTYGVAATTGVQTIQTTVGINFTTGIGFCLTGASANADTTATATGIVVNLLTK